MTDKHEALIFADDRRTSSGDDLYEWAIDAEDWIRRQHARIAELEAKLEAIGAGGVSGQLMGSASIAASAGSEPVAHLWQHSETGRTRVVLPDMIVDADASWRLVGPLFLGSHPSPPEGMVGGWQDIATAPKDGTSIIAYRPSSPPHIECMNWCAYEDADIPGAWHWAYDGDAPRENPPTHWMPLPPPPTTSAGSGKGE